MAHLPSGRALIDAENTLYKAGVASGMYYADFGAGNLGHFVLPAARIVGDEGLVYAVDIRKKALDAIRGRARHDGVSNLECVWGDIEKTNGVDIPKQTIDLISMVNMSSVLKTPIVYQEMKRILKPHGKLLVIDWKKGDSQFGPKQEDRFFSNEVQQIIEQYDFSFEKAFEVGPHHWGLLFTL